MATLEYFVVAESVSTDRETNNVSVFNILEDVSGKLPLEIPRLVAVSAWNMAPEDRDKDFQVTLRIPQPWNETDPKYFDFPINFTTERRRHRVSHRLEALQIKEPGELRLQILLNGQPVATHVITIHDRESSVQVGVSDTETAQPPMIGNEASRE